MEGTWIDDEHWLCTQHARAVVLPATAERCWYVSCSHRPAAREDGQPLSVHAERHAWRIARGLRSLAPAPGAAEAALEAHAAHAHEGCAWHGCDRPARPGSKYCSRTCSNRNARERYASRRHEGPDEGGREAA